ncbi:SMC family ATPase [Deinococcus rubellus]|uniref:SMC family ATPase n=1 Tax=Deinococcus rubellus TaxID=1889240 RepID=UPI0031ECBDA7
MQAFGPYVQKQVIDFAELGDRRLFLIHGPTGAGKTVLLDAICFALYGTPSGKDRDGKGLRSHHAAENLRTEVTFDFALGDQWYRIQRAPEQNIAGKQGKSTKKLHDVTLWELVGNEETNPIYKITPVEERIQDLLGMSVSQFRQVVLLPQGQFRELLTASSTDREKILATLFETDIYERVTQKLVELKKSALKTWESAREQKDAALKQWSVISLRDLEFLELQVREQREQQTGVELQARRQANQAREMLQQGQHHDYLLKQHQDAEQQWQEFLIDAEEHRTQHRHLDRARHAEQLRHLSRSFEDLNKEAADERQALSKAEVQLQESTTRLQSHEGQRGELRRTTETAQHQLETLRAGEDLHTELVRLEYLLETLPKEAAAKVSELTQQRQGLDQQEIKISAQLMAWPELLLEIQRLQQYPQAEWYTALNQRQETLQDQYLQAKQKQELSEEQWKVFSVKLEQLSPSSERLASLLPEMNRLQRRMLESIQMTAFLEGQLQEIHGILSIISPKQTEDKETLTILENRLMVLPILRDELLEVRLQLVKLRQLERESLSYQAAEEVQWRNLQIQHNETKSRHEAWQSIFPNFSIENDLPAQTKNAYEAYLKLADELVSANQEYQEFEKLCQREELEVQLRLHSLEKILERLKNIQEEVKIKIEESIFSSLESVKESLLDFDVLQELERNVQVFSRQQDMLEARFHQSYQVAQGILEPDLESLQADIESTDAYLQESIHLSIELGQKLENLNYAKDNFINLQEEERKLQDEYNEIKILAECASGTEAGTEKFSLQRFVLSAFLDEVLELATKRLSGMSRGRYHLQRMKTAQSGAGATGLDIQVFDQHTGIARHAKTLSGGEGFLASLSLALSLAQVVQQRAGGRHVDTIFIDEGFGTLDPETLDLVMRCLIDLQSEGHLIGVISHVAEMKERIDARLEIRHSTSAQGSEAHFHVV